MKFNKVICLLFFILPPALNAKTTTIPATNDIPTWIGQHFPQSHVGFIVVDTASGQPVLSYDSQKLFVPASTLKLLTTYTSFSKLGHDFTFDTTLFYDPKAANSHQYKGDLGLKFTGDPSFTDSDLVDLFKSYAHGSITGDIIIDDTTFQKPYYGRGWAYDSLSWAYSAPISSIIINENAFYVNLTGSKQAGAQLHASSPLSGIHVDSDVHAQTYKTTQNICQINAVVDDENGVDLFGCWPINTPTQSLNIAIANPHQWAQYQLKRAFNTLNIQHHGQIRFEPMTPKLTSKLSASTVHHSVPLSELIEPVLMHSNNLYAEALNKTLGHEIYQRGTFQAGSYATESYVVEHLKVPDAQLEMYDGSGLSSHDLISPRVMSAVLLDVYRNPSLNQYILPQLPRWGVSGTLHWRGSKKEFDFIGKTGGMTYHSSLAGYLKQGSRTYVVVIMINDINLEVRAIKKKETELLRLIAHNIR